MIYLISGSPRCGKTTVSKMLSKQLGFPWFSADILESIAWVYIPEHERDNAFPKSKVRKETKRSNDIMYNNYSAKEITDLYIKQAQTVFAGIKMFVEYSIKEGHDYIIEGHQIHPELIKELQQEYGEENIKSVVLLRNKVEKIVQDGKKNKAQNDWFIQKTENEETYYKIAEMIKIYSRFFQSEAEKYGLPYYNMDNNFQESLAEVVSFLRN